MMGRNTAFIVERVSPRRISEPPRAGFHHHGAAVVATIRGEPTARARMHDARAGRRCRPAGQESSGAAVADSALTQLQNRRPQRPLSAELSLECRIWATSPQGDLDDALLLEVLERAAIIVNARPDPREARLRCARREDPRLTVRLVRYGGAR